MTTHTQTHTERITVELKEAGVTPFGRMKFAARYLPKIIHDNEHIKAVVYGRYQEGPGALDMAEGMLVATDHRVLFVNHKPGYTSLDELSYEVVMGVNISSAGWFSAMTLYTRVSNYTIRFANSACVDKFADYIEKRRLGLGVPEPPAIPKVRIDSKAWDFVNSRSTGVLSSVNREGATTGAVVHYTVMDDLIYILTRQGTHKVHNIFIHPQVALTIYDEAKLTTVQVGGIAEIESNRAIIDQVFASVTKPRLYGSKYKLPPVTELSDENYVVLRITPTDSQFSEFES